MLGHRVGVAGVIEAVVDEDTDIVDGRNGLVDDGVLAAEELEGEGTGGDFLAGGDRRDDEARRGSSNAFGAKTGMPLKVSRMRSRCSGVQ